MDCFQVYEANNTKIDTQKYRFSVDSFVLCLIIYAIGLGHVGVWPWPATGVMLTKDYLLN